MICCNGKRDRKRALSGYLPCHIEVIVNEDNARVQSVFGINHRHPRGLAVYDYVQKNTQDHIRTWVDSKHLIHAFQRVHYLGVDFELQPLHR